MPNIINCFHRHMGISGSFVFIYYLSSKLGPDCVESTILKITCKISVVIYILVFSDNSLWCPKIGSQYVKITSYVDD